MNIDFQEILKELEFRLPNGIINLNEEHQVTMLVQILRENGVDDANEFAQKARVIFGYVNEATKLNEIFISNGESSTEQLKVAAQVSDEFQNQTGLQIRQRDLLQQASKVSGFMLATFKGSSKALFEAVAKAN